MKITTSTAVAAPRGRVFDALNDREVLRRSIPGCEELIDIDVDSFSVQLKLRISGIKGMYAGTVVRQEVRPPESFTLAFDGKGKAGFVRGTAAVRIVEEGSASSVACESNVQISGAMAAVGSRLLGAAARKLTQDFFRRLAEEIGAPPATVSEA